MTNRLRAALEELREAHDDWIVLRYVLLGRQLVDAQARRERAIDAVLAAAEAEEREG